MQEIGVKISNVAEEIRHRSKILKGENAHSKAFVLDDWADRLEGASSQITNSSSVLWKTRLPMERGRYLVTVYDNKNLVGIDYFDVQKREFVSFGKKVVAWAEFPEPFVDRT